METAKNAKDKETDEEGKRGVRMERSEVRMLDMALMHHVLLLKRMDGRLLDVKV